VNHTTEATVAETTAAPASPGILRRVARPAEVLLGLVFLASALLKATDVNGFVVAIGYYGVVSDSWLRAASALGTLALETGLGTALILGMRPRGLTLGVTAVILLFFSLLIGYAWAFHGLSDCGCIGPIKMGPGPSLLKNAALLGLCAVAWLGFRSGAAAATTWKAPVLKAAVAVAMALGVSGYAYADLDEPGQSAAEQPRPFAKFTFEADGVPYDLGKGEYVVAMLNMKCDHCKASVAALTELGHAPEPVQVVGLCDGTEETLEQFRMETLAEFPLHLIGATDFYGFIVNAPPRFFLVRDGREVQHWDEVPSIEDIEKARKDAPSADKEEKADGAAAPAPAAEAEKKS